MTFVTSQPHSNTNPTNKYRVVRFKDWHNVVYGTKKKVTPVSEHETFEEAAKACEKLNKLEEMK